MRIVGDGDALGEHLPVELVLQERGAACDRGAGDGAGQVAQQAVGDARVEHHRQAPGRRLLGVKAPDRALAGAPADLGGVVKLSAVRSEEHTSELQSLMRISYAVFCLKKKQTTST